jgi:hypothetical protein
MTARTCRILGEVEERSYFYLERYWMLDIIDERYTHLSLKDALDGQIHPWNMLERSG